MGKVVSIEEARRKRANAADALIRGEWVRFGDLPRKEQERVGWMMSKAGHSPPSADAIIRIRDHAAEARMLLAGMEAADRWFYRAMGALLVVIAIGTVAAIWVVST